MKPIFRRPPAGVGELIMKVPLYLRRRSGRRIAPMLLASVLLAGASVAAAPAADGSSWGPQLQPRVSTNKGCLEFGDDATFEPGEKITLFLRIDSPDVDKAFATLFSIKPGGFVTAFQLGLFPTNVPTALL